jgi:type I restriction enzyme M protein
MSLEVVPELRVNWLMNWPRKFMLDDIKKTLWATADKLRANMDAAEYKHLVLGLIFVKYISDTFAARRAELAARSPTRRRVLLRHEATPA